MNPLYKYGVIIAVSLGLFSGLAFWHKKQVNQLVTRTQVTMANQYNQRLITLQNKADDASLTLQEKLKEYEDAKKIEIGALTERHASVVASLSNRPNRPTGSGDISKNPGVTESPKGAYPAELFRQDAEAFANYGRDAEQLRVELLYCYRSYDEVRDTTNKFVKDNPSEDMPQLQGK